MLRENVHQSIIEKIEKLQSALFFPETADRIIPACVVQEVKTDDRGQIWFAVTRPAFVIDPNNAGFACRMDFSKKGAAYHIKVSGSAVIMEEAAVDGCPLLSAGAKHNKLIIRVKIEKAAHFDIPPVPAKRNTATYLVPPSTHSVR